MTILFPRIITPSRVFIIINGLGVELHEGRHQLMATVVNVGHTIDCVIGYLDQNGNPMQTAQTPDAPPQWSQTVSGIMALSPSADGITCSAVAVNPGSDSINLALKVGGIAFSATLAVTVQVAPQVLTSVSINATVN